MKVESGKPKGIKKYFRNLEMAFTCGCLVCTLLTVAVGQGRQSERVSSQNSNNSQRSGNQNGKSSERSQVEVNKDRFGGATRVLLKPQLVLETPNHQLTMSAEAKLDEKKQISIFQEDQSVQVTFTSQSRSRVDWGDKELHFLVDGEPVKVGKVGTGFSSSTPTKPELRVGMYLISVVPLDKLRRVAQGRNVEMRLGKVELTLDAKLLNNLRAFVAASSSQ